MRKLAPIILGAFILFFTSTDSFAWGSDGCVRFDLLCKLTGKGAVKTTSSNDKVLGRETISTKNKEITTEEERKGITISKEGYLYLVDKNKGNIIRITDLFKNYKIKKRKNIKPIGFVIGKTNLYLTNTDGKMFVVDLNLGNIIREEKVSRGFTSKPIIHNKNLFVIRNGSIIKYD